MVNTKEQKINWIENATNEELLEQFETSTRWASDPFAYAKRMNYSVDAIFEDYKLLKDEILKRMTK
jgi:hypothetical protein